MMNCNRCLNDKDDSLFGKYTSGHFRRVCNDCRRIESREYRARNSEKVRERERERYRRNREKRRKTNRVWVKNNPESQKLRTRIAQSNRRARIRGQGGHIRKKDIDLFLEESDMKCFYCGVDVKSNYHLDHYIPLSKNGCHDISNLRISCQPCNQSKGNKMPEDFSQIGV